MAPKTSSHSAGINVLRGLAVMAVVLCHSPFSSASFGHEGPGKGAFPPAPLPDILR